eukprot:CAMPEP_0167789828 /NCGR_PEP_ID=MMETSP0111_2-20121227/10924_1 /TAXON_ID=91324 /ORGANISM="Lotharella globosa, Strain CCCM811" /LENGTH=201 /DNA_ID=CAMNT_0007682083 /DNA_START=764 /DNA_END=1369 /DNA_ORIENTATION=-
MLRKNFSKHLAKASLVHAEMVAGRFSEMENKINELKTQNVSLTRELSLVAAERWVEWRVEDITTKIEAMEDVNSSVIKVSRGMWSCDMFLQLEFTQAHMGVFIYCKDKTPNFEGSINIGGSFILLKSSGLNGDDDDDEVVHFTCEESIESCHCGRGQPDFIKISTLQKDFVCLDDSIRVRARIMVHPERNCERLTTDYDDA